MPLTPDEFYKFRTLIAHRCLIEVDDENRYFAEIRLEKLARHLGMSSASEIVQSLRQPRDEQDPASKMLDRVAEAITTPETYFFRDQQPFVHLRERVLPELIQRRAQSKRLRIWSAASSTGQEVYSLAMLIQQHFPELADWDLTIIASDLSHESLERAESGRYSQFEANRGIPAALLVKYFRREGLNWILSESIRRMVKFQRLNLATDWSWDPKFDLILLRNVLIYFSVPSKQAVLQRARNALARDGMLVLGATETPIFFSNDFVPVQPELRGFFQPKESSQSTADRRQVTTTPQSLTCVTSSTRPSVPQSL